MIAHRTPFSLVKGDHFTCHCILIFICLIKNTLDTFLLTVKSALNIKNILSGSLT